MKGNFQIIILVVFITCAVFGILVFSGAIPINSKNSAGSLGTVVLWGTTKTEIMAPLLKEFNDANSTFVVKYVQKSSSTLDQNLLEALAGGTGPDMILLPDDLAFHYANKLFTIPYKSYPLASFKTNFAQAGEVFLTSKGILAFPITIDPLMMYYNRSMFDASAIVSPPVYWDEFLTVIPALTKKDEANKIIKSGIAMGQFSNINHAKEILSALFMQTGNPIIGEKGGIFSSTLNNSNLQYSLPSVLRFYISFTDPSLDVYSWNKSFPDSSVSFSAENLALYFGFSSELSSLVSANPNQNFLVAPIPQIKGANFKLTDAHVTGLALLSSSKNFNTAFLAASAMATGNFASKFSIATGVPPARRDLLKIKLEDAYSPIFYDSALIAKSWLDPSSKNTDDIFRRMIDGVLSNSMTVENAISDAGSKLNVLLTSPR